MGIFAADAAFDCLVLWHWCILLSAQSDVGLRRDSRVMIVRIAGLILCLTALLAPVCAVAAETRARSILVLDQSEARGPFYYQIFSGLRSVLTADAQSHTTLYSENLDLTRFDGPAYEESLRKHLKEKYRERPIGVVVAIGAAALERVLRWREELWPGVPVVFELVDEMDFARLKLPFDVTGSIVRLPLADSIEAARAVVPDLQSIVFVGAPWDRQVMFRNWKDEISTAAAGLNVIEIVGATMAETRKRVEVLPERSAILYSAIYSDGEGNFYPPATALKLIADKANRPIIVAAETFLDSGAVGGFVLVPNVIGADAAALALRILNGESPSDIPTKATDAIRPIFNWPQMRRWAVSESNLPSGSEIRFREPGLWENYKWQSISVVAVFLIQTALISILLHERKRRSDAELEARHRMTELAHVNRQATAGELSSSITHELNQPLGAILTNTETAELMLDSPSPDLDEIREILSDIRRDDLRASEIIFRMRSLLKRMPFETRDIDLNDTVRGAFELLSAQASARNIALQLQPSPGALYVKGDPVQLQQVILNLVVNSMDAMIALPDGRTVVGRTEVNGGYSAVISIFDSGPGIPPGGLDQVFDPFFTTKKQGMGIGLSIARTIVQAHKGRIWAENRTGGGAVFRLSLPLATY
jgi:signal transduction histidine kinase